jgi:isoleucyl-tRNA synthetase
MARDFVRQVQQLRKDADLEIEDRINLFYQSDDGVVKQALAEHHDYIRSETQADKIESATSVPAGVKAVSIGGAKVLVWISKVS